MIKKQPPTMIKITDHIHIEAWELTENFTRATGAGGQRVNKVSTAVELRFEAQCSPNLPPYVKTNLRKLAGQKWTKDGAVLIRAEQHRSQAMNRDVALERLIALIERATLRKKQRLKTRPSRSSQIKRMDQKNQRGQLKKLRQTPKED